MLKIWESEEGKKYISPEKQLVMRLKDGVYEYYNMVNQTWCRVTASLNFYKDLDFKEIVDTNSHWKRSEGDMVSHIPLNKRWNNFHWEDRDKVKCLTLEMEIKSVLLNWRRLHDDVELDYNDSKWYILYWGGVYLTKSRSKTSSAFGYFSSKEKAQQFYDYMKDDVDKYFKMRKELKF